MSKEPKTGVTQVGDSEASNAPKIISSIELADLIVGRCCELPGYNEEVSGIVEKLADLKAKSVFKEIDRSEVNQNMRELRGQYTAITVDGWSSTINNLSRYILEERGQYSAFVKS